MAKIKKTFQTANHIKNVLRAIVNILNAVIWSLENFFPTPKPEDVYVEDKEDAK